MKKNFLLIVLFFGIAFSSCFHDHDHDISVRIDDDDDVYRFRATFDEDQTRDVQRIIDRYLHHSISFYHGNVETDARLDDGTSIYIKSRPGRLKINFDRSENTEENCERLQQMCDEIKDVIAREENDN